MIFQVAQMPLQDTAEMEVSFEVDHSTMKPLENMSALEMFTLHTDWNVIVVHSQIYIHEMQLK